MIYRFDGFELDEETRQLRRGKKPLKLQPLVFDLLALLVRNHRRVVPKDELIAALWPEVTVTDASLQRAMSIVRSNLADASHELIRTFTGYGYRFCGEVRPADSSPRRGRPERSARTGQSPPATEYVRTRDGVSIAYWTLGEGPPFVYVPNLIWSHGQSEWRFPEIRRWYERLARERMLVRIDPRGTGSSQRALEHYSLESIQLDIDAVVERVGLDTFSMLGDLNGGSVAMRYAATHPERVTNLVLLHAFANSEDIRSPKLDMLESLQPLMDQDWETYTETRAHMGFGWSDGESAHRYASLMRECVTPDVARQSYDAGRRDDVTPLLPHIQSRTLVLHRSGFYFWEVEVSRALAARIPDARLVVLEGAESAPYLGDADCVVDAIDRFLRTAVRGR